MRAAERSQWFLFEGGAARGLGIPTAVCVECDSTGLSSGDVVDVDSWEQTLQVFKGRYLHCFDFGTQQPSLHTALDRALAELQSYITTP